MSLLLLVVTLCMGLAVSQVQVPCYGEGCKNVTVYLGPRWGSRVIIVPKKMSTQLPILYNSDSESSLKSEVMVNKDRSEQFDEKYHRPQHRPVTQDEEFKIDFMEDENPSPTTPKPFRSTEEQFYKNDIRWPQWPTTKSPEHPWLRLETTSTRRPLEFKTTSTNHPYQKVRLLSDKFGRGTVDLSWRGYTGEEMKQAIMTLTQLERRQVAKLILEGNRINYLPVLVFPVEFEYGLQELSLNNNTFSPPYLTSYSRFELSRLGRLMTLNMSQCGLRSIEMPDLPSLEVLDLSYNELVYLPRSLGRLIGLRQLFLRGNKLRYISDSPLSSLSNLWVLDLGGNGLQEIWNDPFKNLGSLVTLKLDNNMLTTVPQLDTGRKKIVSLTNNSLLCSCSLLQRVGYANMEIADGYSQRVPTEYNARCENSYGSILLHEIMKWPERYHYLCDQEKWWGARAWTASTIWYHRNIDIMNFVYKFMGMALVVMVLVAIMRRRMRISATAKSKGIPYSILDEQQVSTVSGLQSIP